MDRFFNKILSLLDTYIHLKSKINMKVSKVNVAMGKKIRFKQETIFFGEGKVKIEDRCSFGFRYGSGFKGRLIELQPRTDNAVINIEENVVTNNGLFICCADRIDIGKDTLIGSNVTIMDHNSHGVSPTKRRGYIGSSKPIKIGENVWLGNYVTILPGTTIGKNSVVGVGSVVKGSFPENVIIQGNPAIVIKSLF